MFGKIKHWVGSARRHLTRLDDQPLGRAALVVVLLLDLFILASIFDGLDKHTAQLTRSADYIPAVCREIVIDARWNPANRMNRLAAVVGQRSTSYYTPRERKEAVHPLCAALIERLEAIEADEPLGTEIGRYRQLERQAGDLRTRLERFKGSYDTALLESTAGIPGASAPGSAVSQEIRSVMVELNAVAASLAALEASLGQNVHIAQLWSRMDALTEADRRQLTEDLRHMNFWYPAKRLGMELAFLLPLIGGFYYWNVASLRCNRPVQTLVSSHLLVVAAIPVVFKLATLVYDIIPKHLLKRVFELLESLNLIALWHYFVIALVVAAAVMLIYLFQKKLFSRERMLERRIARGLCQQCGRPMPAGSAACAFCGFAQLTDCGTCGRSTYVFGRFCRECGAPATAAEGPG